MRVASEEAFLGNVHDETAASPSKNHLTEITAKTRRGIAGLPSSPLSSVAVTCSSQITTILAGRVGRKKIVAQEGGQAGGVRKMRLGQGR